VSSVADFATSADIGRINPDDKPLPDEIVCPQMVFNGKCSSRKTMAASQCMERIRTQQKCTEKCAVATSLRKKYHKKK
jgi:hypothetical protein